jgi:CHAD domain-containing protein/HD superfamily phosphodiesterase
MIAMDPDPNWKAMKKAGKQLFQRLGALRDVQIMMEWMEKLKLWEIAGQSAGPATSNEAVPGSGIAARVETPQSPAHALVRILQGREVQLKREARAALEEFDRKQWRLWSKSLPPRAARIRPGSAVFKHLALERWTTARQLHTAALRNRSQVAFHTLRIGIKRFRYIVENFLPVEHAAWADDLKHMQDLLGEVHDLDVLWATAISCRIFPDDDERKSWHERILAERTKRIDEYRQRTTGSDSLWDVWRAGLPQGKQIGEIATRRMKLWAKILDPDFVHSERVARLCLQLYDGLTAAGFFSNPTRENAAVDGDPRASLMAAALLHDVGKVKGNKGHHKESQELIQKHGTPLGWEETDMRRAALVARFHCGALPARSHKTLRGLLADEQRVVIRLAAILRLANAFDVAHDGHVRRIKIECSAVPPRRANGLPYKRVAPAQRDALIVGAEGFVEGSRTAQAVAGERYLLETVLRRPIVVKTMKDGRSPLRQPRQA